MKPERVMEIAKEAGGWSVVQEVWRFHTDERLVAFARRIEAEVLREAAGEVEMQMFVWTNGSEPVPKHLALANDALARVARKLIPEKPE